MTPEDVVSIAGYIVIVGALGSVLLSVAFCVAPAPVWLRRGRDLALVGIAAAVTGRLQYGIPLGWHTAAFWTAAAILATANCFYNWRRASKPDGDRCPRNR